MFFFFNDTATTEIYTLSLHDALPILDPAPRGRGDVGGGGARLLPGADRPPEGPALHPVRGRVPHEDRKSTRLNSSHANISYAVFCLKKKKMIDTHINRQTQTYLVSTS